MTGFASSAGEEAFCFLLLGLIQVMYYYLGIVSTTLCYGTAQGKGMHGCIFTLVQSLYGSSSTSSLMLYIVRESTR